MFGNQWRCFDFRGLLSDDVGFVQTAGNIPLWTVSHSDFPLRAVSPREKPEWDVSHHFGLFKGRTKGDTQNFCVTIVLSVSKVPQHTKVDSHNTKLFSLPASPAQRVKKHYYPSGHFYFFFYWFFWLCCRSTNNPFAGQALIQAWKLWK